MSPLQEKSWSCQNLHYYSEIFTSVLIFRWNFSGRMLKSQCFFCLLFHPTTISPPTHSIGRSVHLSTHVTSKLHENFTCCMLTLNGLLFILLLHIKDISKAGRYMKDLTQSRFFILSSFYLVFIVSHNAYSNPYCPPETPYPAGYYACSTYVPSDGPSVYLEFMCGGGSLYPNGLNGSTEKVIYFTHQNHVGFGGHPHVGSIGISEDKSTTLLFSPNLRPLLYDNFSKYGQNWMHGTVWILRQALNTEEIPEVSSSTLMHCELEPGPQPE